MPHVRQGGTADRAALREVWAPAVSMTDREALLYAKSGHADYITDRRLTELGDEGLWDLEKVGEEAIAPYTAHGGFYVDRAAVYRSYLTAKGSARLAELETVAGG